MNNASTLRSSGTFQTPRDESQPLAPGHPPMSVGCHGYGFMRGSWGFPRSWTGTLRNTQTFVGDETRNGLSIDDERSSVLASRTLCAHCTFLGSYMFQTIPTQLRAAVPVLFLSPANPTTRLYSRVSASLLFADRKPCSNNFDISGKRMEIFT